jgi:hypothetical protein
MGELRLSDLGGTKRRPLTLRLTAVVVTSPRAGRCGAPLSPLRRAVAREAPPAVAPDV